MLLLDDDSLISFRCNWGQTQTRRLILCSAYIPRDETPHRLRHRFLIKLKKGGQDEAKLPHQHSIKAASCQRCWLESISPHRLHNEHVILSWFQLEQDTNLDSCMLNSLHLRIPRHYQITRWLRQTWLVLWQIARAHGGKLTRESICCAYHMEKSQDMKIWAFWLDQRSRG